MHNYAYKILWVFWKRAKKMKNFERNKTWNVSFLHSGFPKSSTLIFLFLICILYSADVERNEIVEKRFKVCTSYIKIIILDVITFG